MAHFGVLSLEGAGHLNPFIALARELMKRGHRVTLLQKSGLEARIRALGLEFLALPQRDVAPQHVEQLEPASEETRLRVRVRRIEQELEATLSDAPAVLASADLDALLLDEILLAGPSVAELLHLPYFLIAAAVPHSFGWDTAFTSAHAQSDLAALSALHIRGPLQHSLDRLRREQDRGPSSEATQIYPPLAHITQMPRCLDVQLRSPSPNFHYTGPFVSSAARTTTPFPWERLDGRPIIYASLGTTWKHGTGLYRLIAEACAELDAQLVISLGGRFSSDALGNLPGQPLVLREVPQLELLPKAAVVLTHGGLNTALETLLHSKPMVVLPRDLDQPFVAACLVRHGVAIAIPTAHCTVERMRASIAEVLNDSSYRQAAQKLGDAIRATSGLARAAEVIEEALQTAEPSTDTANMGRTKIQRMS